MSITAINLASLSSALNMDYSLPHLSSTERQINRAASFNASSTNTLTLAKNSFIKEDSLNLQGKGGDYILQGSSLFRSNIDFNPRQDRNNNTNSSPNFGQTEQRNYYLSEEHDTLVTPPPQVSNPSQPPLSEFLLQLPETLTMSLIPGDEVEPLPGGIGPPPVPKTNFTFHASVPPKQQRIIEQHLARHPEFETFRNYGINVSLITNLARIGILLEGTRVRDIGIYIPNTHNEPFADMLLIDRDYLMNASTNNLNKYNTPQFIDKNTGEAKVMSLKRFFGHEGFHFVQLRKKGNYAYKQLEQEAISLTNTLHPIKRGHQEGIWPFPLKPLTTTTRLAKPPFPLPGTNQGGFLR